MSIWLIRGGRAGEREITALENSIAAIGWEEVPDLRFAKSKQDIYRELEKWFPGSPDMRLHNWAGQLWTFYSVIKPGDIVIMPLKTQHAIAMGKVAGSYQLRMDLGEHIRHVLPVKWEHPNLPRKTFPQDLLFSMGAAMTICSITRNNAETRIEAIYTGKAPEFQGKPPVAAKPIDVPEGEPETDIEQIARDQLLNFIESNFKGHNLARLIDAVLQAEGYRTYLSPPGPDKGVDILAGTGALGFDPPRICVQVKSQAAAVDAPTVRELQGVMQSFKGDHGLLVSWGGFTSAAIRESREKYFSVRLWNSEDILNALLKNYTKLPEVFRAELPLKPIWALVVEEE